MTQRFFSRTGLCVWIGATIAAICVLPCLHTLFPQALQESVGGEIPAARGPKFERRPGQPNRPEIDAANRDPVVEWGAAVDDSEDDPVEWVVRPAANRDSLVRSFESAALMGTGAAAFSAARRRLADLLEERLQFADEMCGLTFAHREKLRLAGRGDIHRFFERFEHLKAKYQSFEGTENGNEVARDQLDSDALPLRRALQVGPFDDGSLFRKFLGTVLNAEQRAEYAALRAVEQVGGQFDPRPREKGATNMDAVTVVCVSGTRFNDAGLERLKGVSDLRSLFLDGTLVTDKGLEAIGGLRRLEILDLSNSQVTDRGLQHLSGLVGLKILYLANTGITDAGLAELAGLEGLKIIHLKGTQASDSGIAGLKQALPQLYVRR
jgi:hypothetical protein